MKRFACKRKQGEDIRVNIGIKVRLRKIKTKRGSSLEG